MWALVAARADVMGLYFARPYNMSSMLGAADITDPLVIFTDGINQYPGSMEKGLALSGSMIYENGRWSTY